MGEVFRGPGVVNPRFLQFKGFKLLLQTIITQDYLKPWSTLASVANVYILIAICNFYTQVASLVYRLMHFIECTIHLLVDIIILHCRNNFVFGEFSISWDCKFTGL